MIAGRMVPVLALLVGLTAACGPAEPQAAVVSKHVDGDTVDVDVDGRTERIRLLNIDAPEVAEPECLADEASEFLASLIPVGTQVTLEYDVERTDSYDRTLAGIFTADGTFVNAEVARAGLAIAVVFGENDRFLPPVEEAQGEARAAGRGMYSADVDCTLPGRVEALVASSAAIVPASLAAGSAEIAGLATAAAGVVATAVALQDELLGAGAGVVSAAISDEQRTELGERVAGARIDAERAEGELQAARSTAAAREAEEARVAQEQAAAEAARVEQERRDAERAREAEQAREAERAREAARDAERRVDPPARDVVVADPPSTGSDPYPGYTGPRCYLPGGQTYRPC